MKFFATSIACVFFSAHAVVLATSVTFGGADPNAFTMEFVTVGNPMNAADATASNRGAVDYVYEIAKYEVREGFINSANSIGSLGITMTGASGTDDIAARGINWFEAATFVNWLNDQVGSSPAYKFDINGDFQLWTVADGANFDASNPFRSPLAEFVLPNVDEYHKAAYYNPANATYFDYPNQSNTVPTGVASGTGANEVVYNGVGTGPALVTQAGGESPYGTFGQGGNVWEWEESELTLPNNSPTDQRAIRGGYWGAVSSTLTASSGRAGFSPGDQSGGAPQINGERVGFRVVRIVAVPEPTQAAFFLVALVLIKAAMMTGKRPSTHAANVT